MNDHIFKFKEELNKNLSSKLNFDRDVKGKVLEKIHNQKQPSYLLQKVLSGVVMSAAVILLGLFTINQLTGSQTLFERSASHDPSSEIFTYKDPDFDFKLEMPSYMKQHIHTYDSQNGRTFYFKSEKGLEQLLFHLDIYKKTSEDEDIEIPGRTLIKETDQYAYYVSDIKENIKIMGNRVTEGEKELLNRFAADFQYTVSTLQPVEDSKFGWSVKTVASHNNQLAKAVDQTWALLEKEYNSNDLETYIEANRGLYNNSFNGQRYTEEEIRDDLTKEFELRNQGKKEYLAALTPYEINQIKVKMIVSVTTDYTEGKEVANRYLATYELVDGKWSKVEWKKMN